MSRLVLVRHGQTIWHADNRYAGNTDIELTPKGHAQAERLAHWAATAGLAAVWSSPLQRAWLTADPCAQSAGLPLRIDERLTELSFGWGEGLTAAEMEARFPAERAAFVLDPVACALPGGEDPVAASIRGVAALASIAGEAPGGRSLVVAHSTLLRLVLCRLMEIPLARYRERFPHFANGALTEVELKAGRFSLLSFNVPISTEKLRKRVIL